MKNGDKSAMPTTTVDDLGNFTSHLGLTKREYFAGLAMQGMVSNSNTGEFTPASGCHYSFLAKIAVKQADALLAAIEEKTQ